MHSKTYLRIKGSPGRVPIFIVERELIHDEHSQRNELPLSHLELAAVTLVRS